MMQFLAICTDTWRLIRARKLFWIGMAITILVGVAYASVGYGERGWSILFFLDLENEQLARGTQGAATMSFDLFYFLTNWWTTFFGLILALITCASIFPEFLLPGSIDTLLSKPISRSRLFLSKFVSGLLFAGAQAVVLALMVFVAIRWRLGFWHWPVWWSVPLGVVFFSYLHAVCVFFGVWTRSTLAALMLTLLVWFACKSAGMLEDATATFSRTSAATAVEKAGKGNSTARMVGMAYQVIHYVRFILPKTAETTELVQRSVMRESDKAYKREKEIRDATEANQQLSQMFGQKTEPASVVRERVAKDMGVMDSLQQTPTYIIGTSLLFEALVLGLGCWMFSRRDY